VSDWTEAIDALTDYLDFRRECGVWTVEIDPTVLAALPPAAAAPAATARSARSAAPARAAGRPAAATPDTTAAPAATPAVSTVPAPLPDLLPSGPPGSAAERAAELERIGRLIAGCERCGLCKSRTRTVPGQGNPMDPDVMFVGEAPGAEEDAQGLAFVGAAGQLLTRMIAAMGYTREQVFIANICKCRPPNNRPPEPDEMRACLPYLRAQIAIIRPKTLVALGGTAGHALLETEAGISRLRGHWTRYQGIPLMPTFHPSYLLRMPMAKHQSWDDLQAVLKHLGRPVPPPRGRAGGAAA
jgi:DNA polymerase